MKIPAKQLLLIISCAFTVILIVIMLAYLALGALNKNSDEVKNSAVQASAADTDDTADTESDPETETEMRHAENAGYAELYLISGDIDIYIADSVSGEVYFDYPDASVSGLYTGRVSAEYPDYVEIDYMDGTALVDSDCAMPIGGAKVLPVGAISQITGEGTGYSACAVACLHMILRNSSGSFSQANIPDYETLLDYAETNGFADQGSLLTLGGGMTFDSLAALAKDVYSIEMVNAYDPARSVSDVVKEVIDGGKQAIVLVKHQDGKVVADGENSHFILVTGYVESENSISFIYANPYYTEGIGTGASLKHISEQLLNTSAGGLFPEPNTVAYAESY